MSVKQSKQHGAPPTSTVLCVWHLRCSSYQSPFVVAPLLEACCEQVNMRNNIVGLLFCHQQTTTTATFTCLQRSRKSAAAAKEIQDNNCTMDLFATGELVLFFVNYCDVRTSCKVNGNKQWGNAAGQGYSRVNLISTALIRAGFFSSFTSLVLLLLLGGE